MAAPRRSWTIAFEAHARSLTYQITRLKNQITTDLTTHQITTDTPGGEEQVRG